MKKICFILSTLQAGGVENYLLRFLKYSRGKYDVTILCASNENAHLLKDYEQLGVRIVFKKTGYYNLILLFKLYKFFSVNNFSVVCNFSGNFSGPSLLLSKIAKIPCRIASYRRSSNAFGVNKLRSLYNYLCNRLVYFNATDILSNSEFALKVFFPLEYKNDRKFQVIKNGVDNNTFLPNKDCVVSRYKFKIPQNAFVIGHVGRYDWSKNHTTIIQVAHIILQKFDDVVFVFCGKDTDSKEFKKSVAESDFSDRFILLGVQKDVPGVLQLMDLFYFPSVTEGQPNALIEAMLTGLPVIASNIEPIRETIPESAHDTLLDPLNVHDAVDLISSLKVDVNKRQEFIHKDWAENQYDLQRNLNLFNDVIDAR